MNIRRGSSCAIATCYLYSNRKKKNRRTDISFHRFPKDPVLQKLWVHKCKRSDSWDPSSSYVCSKHFNSNDYIRDFKRELVGKNPVRRLKPGSVPTVNVPNYVSPRTSSASYYRRNRMEASLLKEAHDESNAVALNAETQSSSNKSTLLFDSTKEPLEIINYECLYRELLKDHEKLKTYLCLQEDVLISVKNLNESYTKNNESLQSQLKILKKNVCGLNKLLKKNQTRSSKRIKQLSVMKTKAIETQAEKYLLGVFSQNQIDLMLKKKKKVTWSGNEISKAFTLMYFSKRAYMYLKNELKYPLPGTKSLKKWARNINLGNGDFEDV